MAGQTADRTAGHRKAFTLVELMIVITIIALLLALLMPALNGAYKMARKTADASLINLIAMGCESYNQVFKEYPPSHWDSGSQNTVLNRWPPPSLPQGAALAMTGAAKLYAVLSGFNAIGCWDPTNLNTWNPAGWNPANPPSNPCGSLTGRGILVHLNPADGTVTEDKTYGPYYSPDPKGATITYPAWNAAPPALADRQETFASRFTRNDRPPPPAGASDETGAPILYYRADLNPPTDRDNHNPPEVNAWGIYRAEDNYMITDWRQAQANNWNSFDTPGGLWTHPLYAPSDGIDPTSAASGQPYVHSPDGQQHWGISKPIDRTETNVDPNNAANKFPRVPYDATTYILISPGPDGQYFTEDDVTNFRQ